MMLMMLVMMMMMITFGDCHEQMLSIGQQFGSCYCFRCPCYCWLVVCCVQRKRAKATKITTNVQIKTETAKNNTHIQTHTRMYTPQSEHETRVKTARATFTNCELNATRKNNNKTDRNNNKNSVVMCVKVKRNLWNLLRELFANFC